ncbi:hypothetical protein HYS93_02960 [Candidatus Daviesbacteria bacterium]|nr:hypothetical protein [Candidatus Daviesbacteria bacterium]
MGLEAQSPITDQRVRQILTLFTPVLHTAIESSGRFIGLSYGNKFSDAVPMLEDEIGLWDTHFGIKRSVAENIEAGKLFVPDAVKGEEPNCDHGPFYSPRQVKGRETYKVNLDEGWAWVPVTPLKPEGVSYHIRPLAYFHGRLMGDLDGMPLVFGGEGLESAFISLGVMIQDEQGRWVHSKMRGTERNPDARILGIHEPAFGVLYFNTSIEPDKPNTLKMDVSEPKWFRATANLHRMGGIDDLVIPDDPKLRLYFWQLDRFIKKDALGSSDRTLLMFQSPQG